MRKPVGSGASASSDRGTLPTLRAASFAGLLAERETVLRLLQSLIAAIAVILLLAGLKAHGQSYTFHSYQKADGLENLNVHCMVQDHTGLLWLCSEDGLFSFDGARIHRVPSFEGREIPYITALHEDGAQRLWVASYHELIYRDQQGMHRPGLPRYGIQKSTSTEIASFNGDSSQIFFLADQALYRVFTEDGGRSWQQAPFFSSRVLAAHPELKTLDSLTALENPADGHSAGRRLWLACDTKLCEVSPESGSVRVWGTAEGVPDDHWRSVLRDRGGRLWARAGKHLVSLPAGSDRFVPEEGSLPAKSLAMRSPMLAEDPQGRIMVNLNDGMARRENGGWHIFGVDNNLPSHLASAMLFDRQGSFWFAIDGHGLEHWLGYGNWESWTARNGLAVGSLWEMAQDHQGALWIAGELGVDRLAQVDRPAKGDRPQEGQSKWLALNPAQPMRQAQTLLVDHRGHLWIGQATGALLDYNPTTQRVRTVARVSAIYNLFQDIGGTIWVSDTQALYRLDPADGYTTLHTDINGHAFPSGGFYEGGAAPDGNLYFIGSRGLFMLARNSSANITRVAMPSGITLPYNSPLAIGKDGTLWVQGESSPVLHLRITGSKAELIERIQTPSVASPSVYQMSIDHRGWLWVGTDRGVDVYNGHQWVGLTTEDGLIWDDTDSDSFHEAADGSVWIGTSGGLSHILHPETIYRQDPLAVHIDTARMGGFAIEPDGNTRVPWDKRGALTLALGISNPDRSGLVHYNYRLEGAENEWQQSDDPVVRYSALPPGRYRVAIKATDDRRHQSSPPVYMQFRLLPPWWRTNWFLCGLAVMIAALVGLASWWRVSALIAQQQRLENLVRERTHQLEMEKKELIDARMALVEQASRDGLTGLLNRTAIFEVLGNEIQYASEKNTSLAIVLADLDHFKRINDTYGHQIGDAVLRECARRFRLATRPTDYVGRYGGEELLLVLPGLSPDNSLDRLETLRATIAHELFDCDGIGLPVTCSFGVAWLDEQNHSIKPLIALADQALYAAKTRGRNRVETINSAASGLFFPDGSGPLMTV